MKYTNAGSWELRPMKLRRNGWSDERCQTCAEPLICLRVGHEPRCEAFHARRSTRTVRIGLALLVLSSALIFFPWRVL